jgi:1-acyl-sn-glycerol-3-phosphate acyltransferase
MQAKSIRKQVLGNDPFVRGAALLPDPPMAKPPAPDQASTTSPPPSQVPVAPAASAASQVPVAPAASAAAQVPVATAAPAAARVPAVAHGVDLRHFFYDWYWRVEVQGAERIPAGKAVIVANHVGALPIDGLMLAMALERATSGASEAGWFLEDQLLDVPCLGSVFRRLGALSASRDAALRLLADDRPILVFPEGIEGMGKPIFTRYQLKGFGRGGFVKLAHEAAAPIVPVAIVGGEEAMPVLARVPGFWGLPYLPITTFPLPAQWVIRFGEPMDISPGDSLASSAAVEQKVAIVRSSIESMIDSLLRERSGV